MAERKFPSTLTPMDSVASSLDESASGGLLDSIEALIVYVNKDVAFAVELDRKHALCLPEALFIQLITVFTWGPHR